MNEPKMCCNCLHCARWRKKDGIECHCDLTDEYLGYLDVMDEDRNCNLWEKETKWDDQRKHDSELLDKVAEKIKCENPTLVPVPTIVWEKMVDKVIAEQKAEVEK